MAYTVGDKIRVSVTFTVSSTATDPTIVTIKYKTPSGAATTWVYGTDIQVIKSSTGNYYADISATEGGLWPYRWEGTGPAHGAEQGNFIVTAANVV